MKKHYLNTSILFIVLLSSCSSLLDIEAENTISGDIYTDTESVQNALTGAYYTFTGISDGATGGELLGGDFIIIPELLARLSPTSSAQEYRWETVLAPAAYRDFVNKDILETNSRVQANWQRAFEAINTVNNILANIDVVDDATEKNRIQGEALAIRGILLFEMVLLWAPDYNEGDPSTAQAFPFRTEAITDINQIEKLSPADIKTVQQVYDQAEEDLIQASTLLEPFGKNGTNLSYYACQGYLAKLSLQKGEWGDAEDYCDEVIERGPYDLVSSPLLAFNNPSNSTEDIFAIQQTLANNVGDRSSGFGLTAYFSSLTESGLGVYRPFSNTLTSDSWFNSPLFADADVRGSIMTDANSSTVSSEVNTAYYKSVVDEFDGIVSTAKYMSSSNVLPVLRLAEIYLIRAEANFENLGGAVVPPGALSDLNEIRTRAGISGLLLTDFTDPVEFFDSLVVERTREFMHEGMLLEDLKRWGAYDYLIGRSSNSIHPWDDELVLPIPRSERDTWSD